MESTQYGGEDLDGPGNIVAEAFAFRLLVRHLRGVSDKAANIDIMGSAGLCRNCVAKWYHAGTHASGQGVSYDDALEYVYGESYGSWKKRYQRPATPEQLEKFEATKSWHARHEKSVDAWASGFKKVSVSTPADPCCYDDETSAASRIPKRAALPGARLRLGVLTVSDRAAAGTYDDASGPAVIDEVRRVAPVDRIDSTIVPDDLEAIKAILLEWAPDHNLVLTTGGTGFGPRDVTPEATSQVLEKQAPGIIDIVHARALSDADHADSLLSRAVAGVRGSCVIVNLPGRPEAARRNLAALMPTLSKAVAMVDPPSALPPVA
ncbi:hypothetical protein CTAYLR_004379 [Chrysophaeum taylorii]|uniref:molybdopterin molybdotransferase n=1 Tax=Chrysophaeum taylorii TaxID=2483200 RepID=A0AAD7UNE5_9STRA|nr:hypothetical protein CTAYLR_004379 [Chrysophaeum taylorii]